MFSSAELERLRRNVRVRPPAARAWQETRARAESALASAPRPANPNGDYRDVGSRDCGSGPTGWYCGLYLPGLEDGRNARALGLAYVVTGQPRYGTKAKEILLAWARGYSPLPPSWKVGHYVAEPVGFMLKAFQAYALVRNEFTRGERAEFESWAARFVPRAQALADGARDNPWVPEAPYGNSATWMRALAVHAAAVVGGRTLRDVLDWNWSHTTPGGRPYGWADLVQGAILPDGKVVEEDVRRSVTYALYALEPMLLIADVARRTGDRRDLWRFTTSDGRGLLPALAHYGPYLRGEYARWPAYTEPTSRTPEMIASYGRALAELANNAVPGVVWIQKIVTHGGPAVRGTNDDPYITAYNGITAGIGQAPKRKTASASG